MSIDRDLVGRAICDAVRQARGYADFFDWHEKGIKEWGIAQTFVEELERDGGPVIESAKQHPGGENLPPDFQLTTQDGAVWAVEITELVSQKAVEKSRAGKFAFEPWPDEKLVNQFESTVTRKDRTQLVSGGPYDRYILLIHVDEDMLPAERLQHVLGNQKPQTSLVDEIYILVSYSPADERCPLLHLRCLKAG